MVLAEIAEITIELLDALLVRLDAFPLQPFVELHLLFSDACLWREVYAGQKIRTIFFLRSSCRRSAAVLVLCSGDSESTASS